MSGHELLALRDYSAEGQEIILAELSRRSLDVDAALMEQGLKADDDSPAPVNRYRDAYRVAASLVWIGDAIKILGFVVAGLGVLVGVTQLEGEMRLGSILLSMLAGLMFWVWGGLIAARGQVLQATLDNAVHSSPFLTNEQRALAMNISVSA